MKKRLLTGLIGVVIVSIFLIGYALPGEAADPKKTEILLGGSLGVTGTYAETSRLIKDAYELWVEDTNKAGGIYVKEHGRKLPVKWILYDDKSEPGTAAKLYEKLVTDDKVDFLTAPFSSGCTFPAFTVGEKYKKLTIATNGSADDMFVRGFKYAFNHVGLAKQMELTTVDLFLHQKPKPQRVALVAVQELYPLSVAAGTKEIIKKAGLELVYYSEFQSGLTDASSIITQAKALNPDVLMVLPRPPSAALFTKQMKALNFRPKLIYIDEGPSHGWFLKEFGKDGEGLVGRFTAYIDSNDPMIMEFQKRLKKKDPTWPREAPDPTFHCQPYDAAEMIRQGIEATGSLDNAKIADYLRSNELSGMLVGTGHKAKFIDFDAYKQINKNILPKFPTQIQNGKIVIVWPAEVAQAKLWYPLEPWPR